MVIDANQWRTLVAVGSGSTVWSVGDALSLGEVPVSRAVKDLVESGLASIGVPPARDEDEPMMADDGLFGVELPPGVQPIAEPDVVVDMPAAAPAQPVAPPAVFADAEPDEADEVARQLANLSPKAARAVAAAAQAATVEEQEAALAEVPDDEEPINRGLLLKFLSSVRS